VLTFALLYAGMVKHLCGEHDEAWRLAHTMIAFGHEHELPLIVTLGRLLQGGMAIQRGAPEDGVAPLTTELAQYRAMGAHLLEPYFLSFLAEGYQRQGKVAEALQTIDKALSLTATNIDVFWEAELYRQKGELTLAQFSVQSLGSSVQASHKWQVTSGKPKIPSTQHPAPNTQEAEACFLKAIDIARQQEARLLELRAAMSLARLWQQRGKKKAARQRLAEIYSWFTEGLDTKDLQAAKALLAELA
jgi:predicted ATPase